MAFMFYSSHNNIYSVPFLDKNDPDIKHQRSVLETGFILRTFDVKENDRNLFIYSTFFRKQYFGNIPSWIEKFVLSSALKSRIVKSFNLTLLYRTALDPARNLLFYGDLKSRSISVDNVTSMK